MIMWLRADEYYLIRDPYISRKPQTNKVSAAVGSTSSNAFAFYFSVY